MPLPFAIALLIASFVAGMGAQDIRNDTEGCRKPEQTIVSRQTTSQPLSAPGAAPRK